MMRRATATEVLRMVNRGKEVRLNAREEFRFRMKILMQIVSPKRPRTRNLCPMRGDAVVAEVPAMRGRASAEAGAEGRQETEGAWPVTPDIRIHLGLSFGDALTIRDMLRGVDVERTYRLELAESIERQMAEQTPKEEAE